ncbi:MAG TPA: hypothetical protein VMV44_13200 [Rectinemataceae bacterium]|nr:hypothetical protein [Rectinemataceae bacterium]
MASSRDLKDDALFLGALLALLVGTGLLLETTGTLHLPHWGLPVLVLAAAGVSLWLFIVRGRSAVFLGTGVALALSGIVLLVSALGVGISRSWPLVMASLGLGLLAYGSRRLRGLKAAIAVPSLGIVLLALFFALFSFRVVTVSLAVFVSQWWPLLFIIGGISMFLAWSLRSRRDRAKRRLGEP